MSVELFLKELENNQIEYQTEYSLKSRSTFCIGGVCAVAVFPDSAEKIAIAIASADKNGVNVHVSGRGSNTLFSDGYLNLCVIFTTKSDKIRIENELVFAESGVGLMPLCSTLSDNGLSGLEFACGIPGSIGGAVFMNAGAHGGNISDAVVSTRAYDRRNGKIITVEKHNFGYRQSIYMSDRSLICLEAKLALKKDEPKLIKARMRELLQSRREKQPLEFPSAGSYFKRPDGDFAGRLVEICGLKGFQIGGAEISEKHAGFVINTGNATFDDVMRLEEQVRERVFRETGVLLEREVEVVK